MFFFLFDYLQANGQTTLFSENMGTPSGTTAIASNSFQNSGLTFIGTSDVRNSGVSSAYTGASGGGNVFITNSVGKDFQIAGISTVNYSNLVLSFGAYKSTTASNMSELVLEYSTDGTSYSTISFPNQPTGSGTGVWRLVSNISVPTGANGATNLRIRFKQTSATPQFRIDDVKLVGTLTTCSTPTALSFQTQPSTILQNSVMSPSVSVAAICADGSVATGYSGNVTLTVNTSGCGYTSQTVSFVNGVGTFSSIVFTRSPQTNLSFTATSSGLTSAVSTSFNVNAPVGVPTITTIIQNNFDAIQDWSYNVGPDVIYGDAGSSPTPAVQGIGVVDVQNINGTNVLRKSYSVDNSSGEYACSNTVTFSNQLNLSSYNDIEFSFNVFSYASGACGPSNGCGNDSGEDFNLDITTDGGITWITILNEYGWSGRLFPQSASPVTSLSVISVSNFPSLPLISSSSDSKSAFVLSLSGISQFQFRFRAKNNRTNENWAIDNAKLAGISNGIGTPFNLPTVNTGADVWLCSGSSTQLNATVSSCQNPVTYSWSPSAFLSNSSISNPSANVVTSNQTYTLTITDSDNCSALDQTAVNVISPPSILAISPP